jgi:hypothetical protein
MKQLISKSMISLAAVLAASLADAAPLAPKRPSQLVDLQRGDYGTVCPYNSNAVVIDKVLKADGTTEKLAIPDDQVLVVTGVEFNRSLVAAGHRFEFVLFRSTGPGSFAPITSADGVSDGAAHVSVTLPSGSSVKPGVTICAAFLDFTDASVSDASAVVHGFFTRDR